MANRKQQQLDSITQQAAQGLSELQPPAPPTGHVQGEVERIEETVKANEERASSSGLNRGENTSNPPGRPRKNITIQEEGTDNTDRQKGRPASSEEARSANSNERLSDSTSESYWQARHLKTVVNEYNKRTGDNIGVKKEGNTNKAFDTGGNKISKSKMIKLIMDKNKND